MKVIIESNFESDFEMHNKNGKSAALLVFISLGFICWNILPLEDTLQSRQSAATLIANPPSSASTIDLNVFPEKRMQNTFTPQENQKHSRIEKTDSFMKGQDTRTESSIQAGQPLSFVDQGDNKTASGVRTDNYANTKEEIHYPVSSGDKKQGMSLEKADTKQIKIAKNINSRIEATKTYGMALSNKRVGNINEYDSAPNVTQNNQGQLKAMGTTGNMGTVNNKGVMLTQGVLQNSRQQ